MDQPTLPEIEAPPFKLVEKKNFVKTHLPAAALAVSTMTAITAAAYYAAKQGTRDGLTGVTLFIELAEGAKEKAQELTSSDSTE